MNPIPSHPPSRQIIGIITSWIAVTLTNCAFAQSADFNVGQKSWFLEGSDVRYRLDQHQASNFETQSNRSGEYLRLSASLGTFIHARRRIVPIRIIKELRIGLWLKADKPGLQIRARVVFPRNVDPQTGNPLTTILNGSSYKLTGSWERLFLENIPLLLERQTRILRAEYGPDVDHREAYIDQILLNAYGGVGTTNLWIGEIDFHGAVPVVNSNRITQASSSNISKTNQSRLQTNRSDRKSSSGARLKNSGLIIDGKTFFPRAIEYQGESLTYLKQLGFNTITLSTPPSESILEQADQTGMWIICPPPDIRNGQKIDSNHNQVLAWDLGSRLSSHQLQETQELVDQVRRADNRFDRPLICHADTNLRAYSRLTSLLLLDRRPLGTTFELTDYFSWLKQRPNFARPVTLFWSSIQTEIDKSRLAQLKAVDASNRDSTIVESQQIRLLTYTAVSAGMRGLCFRSSSRLDKNDPETRYRAESLELINLEISVIQPWILRSNSLREADSNDPTMKTIVIGTQRSHLMLATKIAPGSQYTVNPSSQKKASIVVPGVPESSKAYLLTPFGLKQLPTQRVTGGAFASIPNTDFTSAVIFTEDPLTINQLDERLRERQARISELRYNLAARELEQARDIHRRLAVYSRQDPQSFQLLRLAENSLRQSSQALGSSNPKKTFEFALESSNSIAKLRRISWESAVGQFKSPISSPYCVQFNSLPVHWYLADRLRQSRLGNNQLYGGEFENLNLMQRNGWSHRQHKQEAIESYVELSPERPYSGQFSLRMRSSLKDPNSAIQSVESPPVWVTSAPVRLQPETFIRIHGWVRVDQAISGSSDGLLIIDSFGGMPLAERIHQTNHWQEFTLYRTADSTSRPLTINFVLTGLGEVFLDDLTVTPLIMTPKTRTLAPFNQARRLQNLFTLPR